MGPMACVAAEERKTRAAVLFLQGRTGEQIARELGCSPAQVSYDLADLKRLWKERAAEDRLARVGEALAKLDLVEACCWAAGDMRAVLKCLDMRFRVLGAYQVNVTATVRGVDWDAIAERAGMAGKDTVTERLARLEGTLNGHS